MPSEQPLGAHFLYRWVSQKQHWSPSAQFWHPAHIHQKDITRANHFSIGELGGLKHNSSFHKPPSWTDTKPSHNFDRIGLIGNRRGGGPFGIVVRWACLQQAGELIKRRSSWNTTLRYRNITLSSWKVNIPKGSVPLLGSNPTRVAKPHSIWRNLC